MGSRRQSYERQRRNSGAFERQRDLEKRLDRAADRWLAKHGQPANQTAKPQRPKPRKRGQGELPAKQRRSPAASAQRQQPPRDVEEAPGDSIIGKTRRCIRCRKRAKLWQGHVHRQGDLAIVLAGFCPEHAPGRDSGPEHAEGLPGCPGCYGVFRKKLGVRPIEGPGRGA